MQQLNAETGYGQQKVDAFIRRAKAQVKAGDDASFFDLGPDFDELVADSAIWTSLLNAELARVADDGVYEGGGRWQMRRLLLHNTKQFSLSLTARSFELAALQQRVDENKDYLLAPGSHVMVAFLHGQPVVANRYRLPAGAHFDLFDPSISLEFVAKEHVSPGQRIEINGYTEAVDIDMPVDSVAVVLNGPACVSQIWSIETQTLRPVGASLVSEEHSILMTMVNEISRARHRPALQAIHALTSHADHNVRWCAMKCLGRLDAPLALERLSALASDPHPHVAAAARATLASSREHQALASC